MKLALTQALVSNLDILYLVNYPEYADGDIDAIESIAKRLQQAKNEREKIPEVQVRRVLLRGSFEPDLS